VSNQKRTIGLFGAIGVGVGAIVGGGILALVGVAFASTGPSAIVAFALNGLIALITALSFAELSASFPESGGTYIFSKKVMSIRAAFAVGWVVWFATIVAGVLYAIGAGYFLAILLEALWELFTGQPGEWITFRWVTVAIAIAATLFYTIGLIRKPGSGGAIANIGKIVAFSILIFVGIWFLSKESADSIKGDFTPFFAFGALGFVQAMGYTFIAYQGFDLIAAVAGEVKDPGKTIPRAMIISLFIAMVIYLPLIFVITVDGTLPGQSITQLSIERPVAVVAIAAENYLGRFGFWVVVIAAILSMLSALYAHLFAASRIAQSMAGDRTLPRTLGYLSVKRGTPVNAIIATALVIIITVIVIPDVAAAGAAASLIFLLIFALAHGISILIRKRRKSPLKTFRTPFFPLVPVVGIVACLALAVFQGIMVPLAGIIAVIWLGFGGLLYLIFFARRARILDASAEGYDPELVRLRGKTPLVLVPIANPSNASAMVAVANTLVPPDLGRILLLSVVIAPEESNGSANSEILSNTQEVLKEALSSSLNLGLTPEVLTTVAKKNWPEIIRVSKTHRCESLLVGLSEFTENKTENNLENLFNSVDCDVVVLRAPSGWQITEAQKILVPVAGAGTHSELLARILGSICRSGSPQITYLRVMPEDSSWDVVDRARKNLFLQAQDEAPQFNSKVKVEKADDYGAEIIRYADDSDLIILGLQSSWSRRRVFGELTLRIARESNCPILMISRRV